MNSSNEKKKLQDALNKLNSLEVQSTNKSKNFGRTKKSITN